MATRMLCADCRQTAVPVTVLRGSDALEALGWCAFLLPGLLYCAWRHALRGKACPHCGGAELVREARRVSLRTACDAPPSHGPHLRNGAGASRWPSVLRDPRERLRRGGSAFALAAAASAARVLVLLQLLPAESAVAMGIATSVAATAWLAWQIPVAVRMRAAPACRAWDRHGRPLRIELVV